MYLAKGQQKAIAINTLKRLSIGNNEIISTYKKSNSKLLVKAKKLGFSDLLIWQKGKKICLNVYVVSKQKQLNLAQNAKLAQSMGLQTKIQGKLLILTGLLQNIKSFKLFSKSLKRLKNHSFIDVQISESLKNEIISTLYLKAISFGATKISCQLEHIQFFCDVKGISKKHPRLTQLFKSFNVSHYNQQRFKAQNYRIHYYFLSFDHGSYLNRKLGLDQISLGLSSVLQKGANLTQGQFLNLAGGQNKAQVLATPSSLLVLDQPSHIRLGSQMPVSLNTNQGISTSWKFYGLELKSKLSIKSGKYFLEYESSLTTPSGEQISGANGQSSIYLKQNKLVHLFELGMENNGTTTKSIPILKHLPIFKYLFESKSNSMTRKKVLAFIYLQRA